MSSRGAYGYGYGKGKEYGMKVGGTIGGAIGATIGVVTTFIIINAGNIVNFITNKMNKDNDSNYKGWEIEDEDDKVIAVKNGIKLCASEDEDIIKIIDKYEKKHKNE